MTNIMTIGEKGSRGNIEQDKLNTSYHELIHTQAIYWKCRREKHFMPVQIPVYGLGP